MTLTVPVGMFGARAVSASFLQEVQGTTSGATSYTFTVSLDAANATRMIVLALIMRPTGADNTTYPTITTYFGATPTMAIQTPASGATSRMLQIWYAAVPTNGNTTLTLARGGQQMLFALGHVWSVTNLNSFTPVDAKRGAIGTPASASLNTSGGGFGIQMDGNTSGTLSWTFTGIANSQQSTAGTGSAAAASLSSAILVPTATATPLSCTASSGGATADQLVASWQ